MARWTRVAGNNGGSVESTVPIWVRVPGLVTLDSNSYFYLLKCVAYPSANNCPATGYGHVNFYHVRPWVKTSFGRIAKEYHLKFPTSPLLMVSDASLEWGGLYDINGYWNNYKHRTHRIGTDIDVSNKNNRIQNRVGFRQIACYNDGYPKFKTDHYHVYFQPYIKDHLRLCK